MFNLNTLDKIAKENVSHTFKIKEIIVFFYTICIKKRFFYNISVIYKDIFFRWRFNSGLAIERAPEMELNSGNAFQERYRERGIWK